MKCCVVLIAVNNSIIERTRVNMQMLSENFLVFVALFYIAIALELPPEFRKCKRTGDNVNECLKGAIQDSFPIFEKGLPGLNIPSYQPINVAEMHVGEGKTGAVQVVQNLKNVKLYNYFRAKVDKVDAKITDTRFDLIFDTFVPDLRVEADYEFNGRVLVLPIVGNGQSVTVFKDMKVSVITHGEVVHKKGQNYAEIKDFKVEIAPGNIHFNFMNLFNGDKRLGDEMNKLLNDNWKDIWGDVSAGYEEMMALVFRNIANSIFKKVPFEQIFLQ